MRRVLAVAMVAAVSRAGCASGDTGAGGGYIVEGFDGTKWPAQQNAWASGTSSG